MRLLLLDDDEAVRAYVARALTTAGHVVDECATGEGAIFLASDADYAVLIFDRMVPGVDGLTALRRLRAQGVSTPAIILTAMDGISDRVEGLEGGADDYLVKPFATTERIARVQTSRQNPLRFRVIGQFVRSRRFC